MTAVASCATLLDSEAASVSLELQAVPSAPRQTRTFTREFLRLWGEEEELTEAAVLIVCELATNAIRHGHRLPSGYEHERESNSAITLTLELHPDALRIEVRDGSSLLPIRRVVEHESDCGRGLMIITALAESWSFGRDPDGGKWVRVSLSRTAGSLP